MSGKHRFTGHLTRSALLMLAMSFATACALDEPYDTEPHTQNPSVDDSQAVLAQAPAEDMSLAAVHQRLLNMTGVADHERDTYDDLLDMTRLAVAPSLDGLHAARSVCYSALTGTGEHSIIMVPLPSSTSDLDATCHLTINSSWHAGGVAKPRYYFQDCNTSLDNTLFGGGYTSYVSEAYFESNRANYPTCGPANAVICCSPQFPN
jgi:hypothetical protein